MTIVCTIHQPNSDVFAMFERIIVLAEGQLMYLGETDHALKFFHMYVMTHNITL